METTRTAHLPANPTPTLPARILAPIDGGSYLPRRTLVVRGGFVEADGTSGQDVRPHGGTRVWKAERIHQTGRRARRGQARAARRGERR